MAVRGELLIRSWLLFTGLQFLINLLAQLVFLSSETGIFRVADDEANEGQIVWPGLRTKVTRSSLYWYFVNKFSVYLFISKSNIDNKIHTIGRFTSEVHGPRVKSTGLACYHRQWC